MTSDRRVLIGIIVGAQGVRGAVRIKSYAARPEDIAVYGPLQDKTGRRRFEVKAEGFVRGAVVARIAGVTDRDAAEALRGIELYLDRAQLPPPEQGEYYQADLIGLAVQDKAGVPIGVIRGVVEYGAGPLLEIERAGDERKTVLVPFTKTVLVSVDMAGGCIVVDPPLGLLEETRESDAEDGHGVEG